MEDGGIEGRDVGDGNLVDTDLGRQVEGLGTFVAKLGNLTTRSLPFVPPAPKGALRLKE